MLDEATWHKVVVDCDWQAASRWCEEHVGEFDRDWYKLGIDPAASLFNDNTTTWYFRQDTDAVHFALRWK